MQVGLVQGDFADGAKKKDGVPENQEKKVESKDPKPEPKPKPEPSKEPPAEAEGEGEKNKKLGNSHELMFAVFLVSLAGGIFLLGREYWDERYYTPDEGLGYFLGLTGGIMMLLAMCYTLFKYVPKLRHKAVMKNWLFIHLFLGIFGPFLVMFHSGFFIGSLNGGIALTSMGLVFLSGVIGRFLYSKTHFHLGGKKARVKDIQEVLKLAGRTIKSERLDSFSNSVLSHRDTLPNAVWELMSFGWRSRWLYFRLTADLHHHILPMAKQNGWNYRTVRQKKREFKRHLREYIVTLKKVALFHVYERFFSFWRNAHVPLLYLLFMSGIVHVVAVHMY